MPSIADRLDSGPPGDAGALCAFGLALAAHLLLVVALTWGVNWKHSDSAAASFSAELWPSSLLPTPAAAVPEPPPVLVTPAPSPSPVAKAPPSPSTSEAEIALAQKKEKKLKLLAQQHEAEAKQLAAQKKEAALALKEKEKQAKAKQLAAAEEAQQLAAKKLAKQQATDKSAQAAADKFRQQNMQRMMADSQGSSSDASASRASAGGNGSSRTYGAIVRAAIKPNVVFTEEVIGNPMAKIEVRLQADGTILSQKVVQPSGNTAWDQAAINAIIRTRVMPRDIDGRIPDTILILEMRPRG